MSFDYREYRKQLGFKNQENLKKYFKAKDIVYINWEKIEEYNLRLKEIFQKINYVVHPKINWSSMNKINLEIDKAYNIMKENNIFTKLNNNGRNPEDVYYNWMRGYIVCKYFAPALSIIFGVSKESIKTVGHDSLTDFKTFSKSPMADLEIKLNDTIIRLEIQSGFTGINDIKYHKVQEAKRVFENEKIISFVVHFDLFNGTMAIINITNINENNTNWITRSEMEGQKVFSIPEKAFQWFFPDEPPYYLDIIY
ncbi:hypothetical protein I6E17_00655 [Fusobacterium perfoetens]|uniref:hypothetical protein n=1 Tax=Fusobacterium perfoetens TaxID=852 RepID=UPI001F269794|nr:hypothetical protein [Fusobacterium perfoetens]MCF2624688.1 hypothetical protein [Fusobacterium perfoetens]